MLMQELCMNTRHQDLINGFPVVRPFLHSPYGEFGGTSGCPDGRTHSPEGEFENQGLPRLVSLLTTNVSEKLNANLMTLAQNLQLLIKLEEATNQTYSPVLQVMITQN